VWCMGARVEEGGGGGGGRVMENGKEGGRGAGRYRTGISMEWLHSERSLIAL
jgi:hypothetical protein